MRWVTASGYTSAILKAALTSCYDVTVLRSSSTAVSGMRTDAAWGGDALR
jgi:hypothetical protein